MSVGYNSEGYFSEYTNTEIPYEKYTVCNIVARQQRACRSFFRDTQVSGGVEQAGRRMSEKQRPAPRIYMTDYRNELTLEYPQLREAIDEPTDEIVQLKRYEACIALIMAQRCLKKALGKVARLCKRDKRMLKSFLDEIEKDARELLK